MRLFIWLLLMCSAASVYAGEERDRGFRFGGQVSGNNYRLDDPDGKTASGSGVSLGAVAIYEFGRNSRVFANGTRESYKLAASSSNIGQEVVSLGGSLSYQKMWRLSRDIKPWFGAGLGYTSSTYRKRYMLTPSGLYSLPLADRDSSELSWLLNANVEFPVDNSFDVGFQAQFTNSFNSNTNALRLGVYVVY